MLLPKRRLLSLVGNTVFQMFYVVIIILLSLAAWPLRTVLRQEADPFGGGESVPWLGAADRAAVLLGYSACFLVSYVCYLGVDMDLVVERIEASGSQWSGELLLLISAAALLTASFSRLLLSPLGSSSRLLPLQATPAPCSSRSSTTSPTRSAWACSRRCMSTCARSQMAR